MKYIKRDSRLSYWVGIPIILAMVTETIMAQQINLVSNPSFEDKTACPATTGKVVDCEDWSSVGSADYYHVCNNLINGFVGVPDNNRGSMPARTGEAYGGLITIEEDINGLTINSHEFLVAEITLTAGVEYEVSFYASLSLESFWATQLSFYISDIIVNRFSSDANTYFNITPDFTTSGNIDNIGSWDLISGTFTATSSGTFFLQIGNFSDPNSTPGVPASGGIVTDQLGYYYIDDVRVRPYPGCCPDNLRIENISYSGFIPPIGADNTIRAGNNVGNPGPNGPVIVENGATVSYTAGTSITLEPGFTAVNGSNFTASIGACPATSQSITAHIFPSFFSPDGDGDQDELCITVSGAETYDIVVHSIIGQLIFSSSNNTITTDPVCVWNGAGVCADQFFIVTVKFFGCGEELELIKAVFITESLCKTSNTTSLDEDSTITGTESTNHYQLSHEELETEELENKEYSSTFSEGVTLFPNPSNGIFNIVISDKNAVVSQIVVQNMLGRTVYKDISGTGWEFQIDLSNSAKGVYLLYVQTRAQTYYRKIINQ